MLNYTKLVALTPTVYCTITNELNQVIELVEHPIKGDEEQVIAVCHELKLASYTGFYDTEDLTNTEHNEYRPYFIDNQLYIGDCIADN